MEEEPNRISKNKRGSGHDSPETFLRSDEGKRSFLFFVLWSSCVITSCICGWGGARKRRMATNKDGNMSTEVEQLASREESHNAVEKFIHSEAILGHISDDDALFFFGKFTRSSRAEASL